MNEYIKLIRPKHWIKNFIIFAALFFSGRIVEIQAFITVLLGFLSFCLISSAVYIMNDICDVDKDRNHEVKRYRPLASGKVPIRHAYILDIGILLLGIIMNYLAAYHQVNAFFLLIGYFLLNVLYSFAFKNIPILDISILVCGFLFRVLYGATIINQNVSSWLYLTVITLSFYLVLGKRRNELVKVSDDLANTRTVLKFYNRSFLDKNMYVCLAMTIVFYSLWCVNPVVTNRGYENFLVWTVPLVILICMKYSLCVESGSYGDPVDVLFGSKTLLSAVGLYCALIVFILYGKMIFMRVN